MRYDWTEYANPWVYARLTFQPATADTDRPFQRLSDWRARLGAAFVIYLSVPFSDWRTVFWDIVGNASISLFLGAFVAVAAVLLFWLGASRPLSPATKYYMSAALKRAALSLAVTMGMGVMVRVTNVFSVWVIGWIIGWWLIIFSFAMMWYCLRWVFGVSEVSPLLGPVVSAVTVTFAFTAQAIVNDSGLPGDTQKVINLSGLATVCLLALCEFLYEAYAGRRAAALYPSHPGYTGHAPASFRYAGARWNGFAIASLALAMVCWPVSVVFAVLALRQVRETGERGAGLAWASLATTAAFFLFMCVVLVARSGWWAP